MQGISRIAASSLFLLALCIPGVAAHAAYTNLSFQTAQPALNDSVSASLSRNWSGYAATGSSYTNVTGTWIVPNVSASQQLSADATWVGIGGMSSRDLIQIGTQAIVQKGQVSYQAWYELLPDASVDIPLTIEPGDSVTATITETTPGNWALSIVNHTTGKSYATTVAYSSSHSSAEWIEEMPSAEISNSFRLSYVPLDNFGSVSFTNAGVIANGAAENLSAANAHAVALSYNGSLLASSSSIGSDGQSFTITRAAGAQVTAPLTRSQAHLSRRGQSEQWSSAQTSSGVSVIRVIRVSSGGSAQNYSQTFWYSI